MTAASNYTVKQLRFTFTLATNAKFQGGNNTLQITGLRATADIDFPGPPSFPTANVRIYGIKPSDMQALTGLTFQTLTYQRNSILIETNSGNGWNTVFAGQMVTVVPDFSDQPNVNLQIFAQTLGYDLLNPATPTSFAIAPSYQQVFQTIVQKLGQNLDNIGVTGTFGSPRYWAGTPAQQLRNAAQDAGIVYYLDKLGVVEIGLPGAPRNLPMFVLTPTSGLIGYPTLNSVNLIGAQSVYNPAFRFGAPILIKGSVQKNANGNWIIYDLKHRLSSLMPDGPWFSDMTAQPPAGFGVSP